MKLPFFTRLWSKSSASNPLQSARKAAQRKRRLRRQRGVAIITVLSLLVLMSVLVISFFTMSRTERIAAKGSAELNRNISLRDIAINTVIARIRQATTEGKIAGTSGNAKTVWVSQPGAITTFISDPSHNGDPSLVYKLYSCRNPVLSAELQNAFAQDLSTNWRRKPHVYVDINRPVFKPSLDPSKANMISEGTYYSPILDPKAFSNQSQEDNPEGFGYSPAAPAPGAMQMPGVEVGKTLPMPVMWLYVLEDGTVGRVNDQASGDDPHAFVAENGKSPTPDNPIVGRIAFWTDDESCKINVNTAAEGVFWDTPRCNTKEEEYYATHQPPTGEYYRYPAHPAQVCLSSVLFPNRRYVPSGSGFTQGGMQTLTKKDFELLIDIAPMVTLGPSNGGETTVPYSASPAPEDPQDRLFTSYDEMVFRSKSKAAGAKRELAPQSGNLDSFLRRLGRAGFFFTARSSAPEINQWGHPRISMWPTNETTKNSGWDNGTKSSILDEQIAFTSRFGTTAIYYVQREDPNSRHTEYYNRAQGRNVRLMEYLRNVTSKPVPGYAYTGSFLEKYMAPPRYGSVDFSDRDQIMLEIIDYLRSINLNDPAVSAPYTTAYPGQHAAFCGCAGTAPTGNGPATHRAVWSRRNLQLPKGQGRIYSASEIALWVSIPAVKAGNAFQGEQDFSALNTQQVPPDSQMVQISVLAEAYCSGQGWTQIRPNQRIAFGSGTSNTDTTYAPVAQATVGNITVPLELGVQYSQQFARNPGQLPTGVRVYGGQGGVRMFSNADKASSLIYFKPFWVPGSSGGGTLKISASDDRNPPRLMIYDSEAGSVDNLVQVIYLKWPEITLNLPSYNLAQGGKGAHRRMAEAFTNAKGLQFIQGVDVVKSFVPGNPDYRLVTAPRAVDLDIFIPHKNFSKGQPFAHSLVEPPLGPMLGADIEPLFPLPKATAGAGTAAVAAAYGGVQFMPDGGCFQTTNPEYQIARLDKGARGICLPQITGDFTTGTASAPDGSYAGKSDEGDYRTPTPYFSMMEQFVNPPARKNYLAPNRYVSGPGKLGQIATGIQNRVPWQTLLLRPSLYSSGPELHYGTGRLNGASLPPDHLLMDYFWMPVVQPYPISDPMATKGKINLNYQIQPFTYITRATALHALLKPERILAIPASASHQYKSGAPNTYRRWIDVAETRKQIEDKKWKQTRPSDRLFRNASEICDLHLVPEGVSLDKVEQFWKDNQLTSDDARENPYANVYPRLTVRSNNYKVHFIVQTIQKAQSSEPGVFDPKKDKITSEHRGSAVIERAIDAADPLLANMDFITNFNSPDSLDNFYNYRITEVKQFDP